MSEKRLYAVVQFLSDETFSEVPTNWIDRDEKSNDFISWWPNTKNISSLIENRTEPDTKSWSMFDITVIKYCSSLASARRSAADSHYVTTDDEKFGRGQRKKNKYIFGETENQHEENDDDDLDDEEGTNKENDDNSNEKKKKSTKHLKQSINRPTLNPMPIYDPGKVENLRQSINTCSTEKNPHSSTSKNSEIEPLPSCTNIKCSVKERTVKETVGSDKLSPSVTLDLESIPILEIPSIKDVNNTLERIETTLDKIRRANVTTNFELKSLSKRLDKLESCQHNNTEPVENDMAMIIPLLPIKTVESMKEFDDLIISNEVAASQFKKLLLKVGGNTPRINIHRALERTISNACAINCSWRGIRSNYKICNLTFIKIIRDVICSVHSGLTEAEFDVTSAEWFRFAKQRAAREEKRRDLVQI